MRNQEILQQGIVGEFCTPLHYPISKLLFGIAKARGDSPIEVIRGLKLHPGRVCAKRLNRWIGEAAGHQGFLENFAAAVGKEQEIAAALVATANLREAEAEAALWAWAEERIPVFKPFIELQNFTGRPKQIFAEALTGGKFKRVPWNAIEGESITEARVRAGEVCKKHYLDGDGQATNWGPIKSYTFIEAWNSYVELSTEGEVLAVINRPYPPSGATISIGGRDVTPAIFGIKGNKEQGS